MRQLLGPHQSNQLGPAQRRIVPIGDQEMRGQMANGIERLASGFDPFDLVARVAQHRRQNTLLVNIAVDDEHVPKRFLRNVGKKIFQPGRQRLHHNIKVLKMGFCWQV
jgi:hypothetical protein